MKLGIAFFCDINYCESVASLAKLAQYMSHIDPCFHRDSCFVTNAFHVVPFVNMQSFLKVEKLRIVNETFF